MNPPVRIEADNNPLYPLPFDYESLTEDGQRLARVNAVRQYLIHPIGEQNLARQRAFVKGIQFFDAYYLTKEVDDSGNVVFDPYFYDFDPIPTPAFHWRLYAASIVHRKVMASGPRGGAKTTLHAKRIIMQMLSRPMMSFAYATSAQDLAETFSERVKFQLYENSRIFDDFAKEPEFGGAIKPKRQSSQGKTGVEMFHLLNRSWMQVKSAESRQRGMRPVRYILDDPEYDARKLLTVDQLSEWMERLIFRIVLPMVQRPGCGVDWTGTFVSRRHYLQKAMMTTIADGRVHSLDPRFEGWYRLSQPGAIYNEETQQWDSAWPEMWPRDEDQRIALALPPDTQTLKDIEQELGGPAYRAEMLGELDPEVGFFPDPTLERNGWEFVSSTVDPYIDEDPYRSKAFVRFHVNDSTVREVPLTELLSRCVIITLVDSAWTEGPNSDSKVVMTLAYGFKENLLFILDLYSTNRVPIPRFIPEIFKQAAKWRSGVIGPEAFSKGNSIATELIDIVASKAVDMAGTDWLPIIRPIRPPASLSKAAKISSLWNQLHHGKIKIPWHLVNTHPYTSLVSQIRNFDPTDEQSGGLTHDDELDTLSMARYLVGGPAPSQPLPPPVAPTGYLAELRKGKSRDAIGTDLAMMAMLAGEDVLSYIAEQTVKHNQPTRTEGGII